MYTSQTAPAEQEPSPTRARVTPSDVFGRARRCGQRDDAPCAADLPGVADDAAADAPTKPEGPSDPTVPTARTVPAVPTAPVAGDAADTTVISEAAICAGGPDAALIVADDDATVADVAEDAAISADAQQTADETATQVATTALAAAVASDRTIIAATIVTASRRPSPANMPQRRTSDGPTTFASLDAQELPVVREYSAGGLVFDEHGRVAIIARHSRSGHLEWCLPKGHIEKGETPQQTAVREVHEETGILGEVVDSIATIDYWFTGTTQRVHKLVHHYALRQIGGHLTVEGDPDHEAEDAIWVDFADLDGVLSYPNERKIAWLYARKLNRQA
ncbi:NUDIX domain-containing protein [Bifidobacterium samirii]